jgi:signal transduction histidine kinase
VTVPTPLRDLGRTLVAGRDPAPLPTWPSARFPRLRAIMPVLAVIVALVLALIAAADLSSGQAWKAAPGWLTPPMAAATALPVLLIARRRSLLALRLCWLVVLISAWFGPLYTSPWPANPTAIIVFLFVLLVVGFRHEPGVLVWVWGISALLVWLFCVRSNTIGGTLLISAMLLVGHLAGRWTRAKRQLTDELAAEQERGALLAERARIARELHDVVAHHMSLIAVRAETAPYRLGELPPPARAEFAEISQTSRQALAEMRRLLGVLRSEGEAPLTGPQPGLAELPALIEAARGAGTPVSVDVSGELGDLPPAVQLSAYRIVQESLSNAARHATSAPVRVSLCRADGDLVVRISNGAGAPALPGRSGSGRPDSGPDPSVGRGVLGSLGHGLRGMRERAAALGGQLAAYPTEGGGFEVRASLPVAGTTGQLTEGEK